MQGSPVPTTFGELADEGFEHVTYLSDVTTDNLLPTDGHVHYFVNDVLDDSLDPTVITSPDDSEILAIFWHSD